MLSSHQYLQNIVRRQVKCEYINDNSWNKVKTMGGILQRSLYKNKTGKLA